ncbi:histone-lysine N-methyltransferase SETMAR-like [Leptinotarsa decemlineata]|uniref:histone-lysine N-methyltransferase SETMAR-like n=1 Tax=Leptinotarsa decemlineata TaxID=7539 RepID=UPI003D30473A
MAYTNEEMADMHYVHGLSQGNGLEAFRRYAEMYTQRQHPSLLHFASSLHQRLREYGSFDKRTQDCGRHREVRTQLEEAVLNLIEEQPTTSTRKIAFQLNVDHMSVFRVLKEQFLYPHHLQRVQTLLPRDFPNRLEFCNLMLEMIRRNCDFLKTIEFIDECSFSHAIVETNNQEQFSLNVWLGVIGDDLIGPHFLSPQLNGEAYVQFLREVHPVLLEEVSLGVRRNMFLMHDGAPAHFSQVARQHLTETYANQWSGRGGPQNCPARSPVLNPLDFSIWGHLQHLVYRTPVRDVDDLRNRIIDACRVIRETPGIFERIRGSMRRSLDACVMSEGRHIEHLLHVVCLMQVLTIK